MCGFLTEFSFNSNITGKSIFTNLLGLSKHRGPDSTEIFSCDHYQLGFNRLAVLDLSENGNQPKYSPSKRYHVVFNGEIYNYKELKTQYKLKNLKSTSDTEVLVHLLDLLGVKDTLNALNGMFAIAVMDVQANTLYLARDFAGIKPLFYGMSSNGLVAASQFNQVFKHPWFKDSLKLRADVIKEYFAFGYMQAPNTIYKNIFQVKPGECIVIKDNETVERFSFNKEIATKEEMLKCFEKNQTKAALMKAVERQLVSDVPLASFLSGGIDSPLITALAKNKKPDLRAFTLSVKDDALDEGAQASLYAKELGINHEIQQVKETDLISEINKHFMFFGEPFGDYSSIPTYLITKKAKEHHTVMLSGDGGDELFFGYPRMLDIVKNRHWFKLPILIRRPLIRLASKLKLNKTWGPFHYKTIGEWVQGKQAYIFKNQLNEFFKDAEFSNEFKELYNFEHANTNKDLILKLRENEFFGHLQRVLVKVDRMSMANSLEVRVPFLDKEVVRETFNRLPETFQSSNDLKKTLKLLMLDFYSSSSINNKKQGFAVPMEKWLKGPLKKEVKTLVFDTAFYGAGLIKTNAIKDYVKDFYANKHEAAWGVWHIYAWQKWAQCEGLIQNNLN
ncbi:asparagine synthase (glutamine-hydrolyzing) [Seonamhaeicola maritimus]|uniref:asparagine synthase (glutamine-hydrolyzing) n=1 Tax=Seonamhaeicola maritimus TaxID=2591822 RepID=A0A5C7GLU0_9FLAO|nr:asparagine synthase (glutamine-hydrolyzing) [Seonamhaeicola maritimus]TXG38871.1 asparagine synthase (glutamine-hydrolyzing) [Seonamhaeicola maritimus]